MPSGRMPLFGWAMQVTAFSLPFAFGPLHVASGLMELDRQIGTRFYDSTAGGSPILWRHPFRIFDHPEVYIPFIPAVGMISMLVSVLARRAIAGYPFVAMAIVATAFTSFGLWVHHVFTVGLPIVALTFFSAASTLIAIPSGVQMFEWITTLWRGRPAWGTALLFSIGFIVTFVLGGITGVMVGRPTGSCTTPTSTTSLSAASPSPSSPPSATGCPSSPAGCWTRASDWVIVFAAVYLTPLVT